MNGIVLEEIRASTSQILNAASDEILKTRPVEIAGSYLSLAANGIAALILMFSSPSLIDIFLALAILLGVLGLKMTDRTSYLAEAKKKAS